MEFREVVLMNRSYRRFDHAAAVDDRTLRELVDLARRVPSASNRQPLRYICSSSAAMNARIFETLAWAGALPDWPGPVEAERPAAYIVILHDRQVSESTAHDAGIAAQTILLAAVSMGLGGCMLGAIKRPALREIFELPQHLEIVLVLALGKPVEKVVLEQAEPGASLKYYRDADQTHHVPKRTLEEVLLRTYTD